jgi:hypothetical protein
MPQRNNYDVKSGAFASYVCMKNENSVPDDKLKCMNEE